MFVDASAIVAILTDEADGPALAERLQSAVAPITSGIAVYEAALAIKRKRGGRPAEIRAEIAELLTEADLVVVPITSEDAHRALIVQETYDRGTGHPARLNTGDCFAYAVAKNRDLPLLYKGEDFARTDLGA